MNIDTFSIAAQPDIEAIVQLVNSAYRPESGVAGWTHESNWVSGNRISTEQLEAMMSKPDSFVIIGRKEAELVACVHVEKDGLNAYIGMLAVNSELQDADTGKQMLAYAEDFAHDHFGSKKLIIAVVSARSELIAFYQRRGYQKTGMIMDYPLSAGAGTLRHADLKIEMLENNVNV